MNEPVAYMMESPSAKWFLLKPDECLPNETCTPLYTHPMCELSNEEMIEIYKQFFNKKNKIKENLKMRSYFDFARAILRKAS